MQVKVVCILLSLLLCLKNKLKVVVKYKFPFFLPCPL